VAKKKLGFFAKVRQIIARMIATFAANGLATVGAGTLIGIDILDAVILAGTLGCVKVGEDLARAYLDDGKLTIEEINEAFAKMDRKK
tara:strand:- start:4700 stop:4960 length:261 start_codon:yes stop_codon:yes gene_type:complete